MPGPRALDHIRVLDLSRVLAGPWCTQCLADLGADVLKVENPDGGDETRAWSPPAMADMAAYFTCANRSKRSLALDLKTEAARDLVRKLAAVADVFVENFKLGDMERMGLGYAQLRKFNPGLIYCSISGYGRTGPDAARPGYDFVIQAETGLMSITGEAAGAPMKVGVAVSDLFSGLYASQAILAALIERDRTGRGRFIDVALHDCQLAALANVAANALATGARPKRYGNAHANVVPYELFEASDGPLVIAVGNDRQFRKFVELLGAPGLADDPRFKTNALRVTNREPLCAALTARLKTAMRAHWLAALDKAAIPAGPIRTVDDALTTLHARARGLVHDLAKDGEVVRVVRHPVVFDGADFSASAPPRLGEGGEGAVAEWLSAKSAAG
jgi:crotonobetainyl-CoA:carnitine CoA-transferase CaiB-like acyl-CoA transferase